MSEYAGIQGFFMVKIGSENIMTTLAVNTTITKYAQQAPRYTSYPTALKFDSVRGSILEKASALCGADNLSVYIHIPFCEQLCYYCGCNKVVTRHNEKADNYLEYLEQEIREKKVLYEGKNVVALHLGGGSPSFLSRVQLAYLIYLLHKYLDLAADIEMSIELDPRNTSTVDLKHLAELGFKRVSFGVQDTDISVQQAINRVQSTAHISELVFEAKSLGFESINLDLIYGLPKQTTATFAKTIMAAKAMAPHRIALFSYAHLPKRFAAQRKIAQAWLPSPHEKAMLYQQAVDAFCDAGYAMIGLDHFALPTDSLCIAQKKGELHRNFQGYTTKGDSDLLGLGVSAISTIGNAYAQNPKELKHYYHAINQNEPLSVRGILLSQDDIIRRDVIMTLMCNLKLNKSIIEQRHKINFDTYFAAELSSLQPLREDNLLNINDNIIEVPDSARIYIRAICARFDAYLNKEHKVLGYSSAI